MAAPVPILLMTRPAAASESFVAGLRAAFPDPFDVCVSPLVRIETVVKQVDLSGHAGVIFSSARAVKVLANLGVRSGGLCFCVGQATTDCAAEHGWTAKMAGRTADELTKTLPDQAPPVPLLHIHGRHTRGDVARRLAAAGYRTDELVVYDQVAQPLTHAARAVLVGARPVVAPLFSPRTAAQFAAQPKPVAPLFIAALSQAVADPVIGLGPQDLRVAAQPDAASMMAVVVSQLKQASLLEGDPGAQ